MNYSVAVHKSQGSCYGITVPDIAGCFSAGDTLEEALHNAQNAISTHLEYLAEEGVLPPVAKALDDYLIHDDFKGVIWGYVDVDFSEILGETKKATVTLPTLLIHKIDNLVRCGAIKSRSAFLVESATKNLAGRP